ncbi:MAG TPA: phosphotransferase [Ignavibacteria bacterium]
MKVLEYLFRKTFKISVDTIEELKAHSSDRRIFRLKSGSFRCIGIYNKYVEENEAFLQFSIAFKTSNLKVPLVYAHSKNLKYYLEEDLGDFTLQEYLNQINPSDRNKIKLYKKALDNLIDFQLIGAYVIDYKYCYQTDVFNKEQIDSDLKQFKKYFAHKFLRLNQLNLGYNFLVEFFSKTITGKRNLYFMYRDFQPRNIMVKKGDLFFIDYQSGRKGPLQYDLSSFLLSGSIDISDKQRTILLNYYLKKLSERINIKKELFIKNYYKISIIRLLQMLGSYGYSYSVTGKKLYLIKSLKAIGNIQQIMKNIKNRSVINFLNNVVTSKERIIHILEHL